MMTLEEMQAKMAEGNNHKFYGDQISNIGITVCLIGVATTLLSFVMGLSGLSWEAAAFLGIGEEIVGISALSCSSVRYRKAREAYDAITTNPAEGANP